VGNEAMLISSSVGVKPGSGLVSSGLPISDVGVSTEGTGRVGSRVGRVGSKEDGYERGSVRLDGTLEREDIEELEDATDGAKSLAMVEMVEVDMLDATEKREWYELVVDVRYEGAEERKDEPPEARDMLEDVVCEDATELRPVPCKLPRAHVASSTYGCP
jgi:hypothetical protein